MLPSTGRASTVGSGQAPVAKAKASGSGGRSGAIGILNTAVGTAFLQLLITKPSQNHFFEVFVIPTSLCGRVAASRALRVFNEDATLPVSLFLAWRAPDGATPYSAALPDLFSPWRTRDVASGVVSVGNAPRKAGR